jgi:hypothetical protein
MAPDWLRAEPRLDECASGLVSFMVVREVGFTELNSSCPTEDRLWPGFGCSIAGRVRRFPDTFSRSLVSRFG